MDEGLAAFLGASFSVFLTPWITRWFEGKKEGEKETRETAKAVMSMFERMHRLYFERRGPDPDGDVESDIEEAARSGVELLNVTDEIVVRSLEFADPLVREHVASLVEAARWVLSPYLHYTSKEALDVSMSGVRICAREIFGAIIRGQKVPKELSTTVQETLWRAKRTDAEIDEMIGLLKEP